MSKLCESPKTPLRPIAVESPKLISPIELPSNDGNNISSVNKIEHSGEHEETNPKPKLKPLHWDKVRASSDREMVWDQLKSSSFKLDEEMIETLFVANTSTPTPKEASRWQVLPNPDHDNGIRVLDHKKAQNIAIMLRDLNVTVEEVCEGLSEGNTESLGTESAEKLGLKVVSSLSLDLSNMKKVAAMDAELLGSDVFKISKGIRNIGEVVRLNENSRNFSESMNSFAKKADEEIIRIQAQDSVALSLVKEITEYFHGNSAREEAHPFRIFMVVRDSLMVLDRVCKEVGMINSRILMI